MTTFDDPRSAGQDRLKVVALRYANQHGLRPDRIEWVRQGGDEWWLKVITEQHDVKIVFSEDEIEDFAAEGPGAKDSKAKIRQAFASLAR